MASSVRASAAWVSAKSLILPDSPTFCGLSELSSVMLTVPLKVPLLPDVKLAVIEHEPAGAILVPQVFVCEKCELAEMLLILSVVAPVLVSVTCFGKHGRLSLQLKLKLSGTSCTVPLASVMVALFDLVLSVTEAALTRTLVLAGNVEGPVNVVAAPLAVVVGLRVPQAGAQAVPFWVSVQLKP